MYNDRIQLWSVRKNKESECRIKKKYLKKSGKIPYNPPFVHIMGEYAHDTKKDLVKDYSLFVKFK
jgi:hypothetical protein